MKKDEQRQSLVTKWQSTGLLNGLSGYVLENMAVLLHNQIEYNKLSFEADQSGVSHIFRRTSVPLARRVFGEGFLPNQIVSVQAILEPQDTVYSVDWVGNQKSHLVQTRARIIKSLPFVECKTEQEGLIKFNDVVSLEGKAIEIYNKDKPLLDNEAEILAWFAGEIKEDITKEILNDLKLNSKVVDHSWKSPIHFYESVRINASRLNRGANWVVTKPEYAEHLKAGAGDRFKEEDGCFGKIDNISIFVDNSQDSNSVLLGHKGANFNSGYVYCPNVPAIEAKDLREQDENVTRYILTSRYAKIMPDKTYYANLVVHE